MQCMGALGIPAKKTQEWSNGNEGGRQRQGTAYLSEKEIQMEKTNVKLTD